MRAADAATLTAVVAVVLLVSLPRLRDFALRENESDARQLVQRLAELVADPAPASATPTAGELLQARPQLRRELNDLELLEGGRTLRRHGYLFQVVPAVSGPAPAVRAWPWKHGRTGRRAFLAVPGQGLFASANQGGHWTGEAPPPTSPDEGDWARVRER
jgi:cytochrome c-type biogenesis protein CcmH/NrfG